MKNKMRKKIKKNIKKGIKKDTKRDMKRGMMAELARFYEAPEPLEKQVFFKNICQKTEQSSESNHINPFYIFKVQLSYISKWTWLASGIFFAFILLIECFLESLLMGFIVCFIPFFVMVSVMESMRSIIYGMEELEQSAQFSLKSVILVRMGIMGMENMFLLGVITIIAGEQFWKMGLYILVPYLMTSYGSFYMIRHIPGREGTYACAGLAVFVCVLMTGGIYFYQWMFEIQYISLWAAAAVFFFGMTIKEGRNIICKMEDILWN